VAIGTPEEVAQVKKSHTGRFLRERLKIEEETVPSASDAPSAQKRMACAARM
jgi:hypothetical protein